jgi:hypothetical protein
MTEEEFLGLTIPEGASEVVAITEENNPFPDFITVAEGHAVQMVASQEGIIYLYDGTDTVKLKVDRVEGDNTFYVFEKSVETQAELNELLADGEHEEEGGGGAP